MTFDPIKASNNIVEKYNRYLRTTFNINNNNYKKQFEEKISNMEAISAGPYLDVTDSFIKGKSIRHLVEDKALDEEFININIPYERKMYKHQEASIKKAINNENVVVSTGTGSGKTESFLVPIINHLLKEKREDKLTPGIRALIIYPMNALANDQLERLREVFVDYKDITFGSYTGHTENEYKRALNEYISLNDGREPLDNEMISRDQMKKTPPHIFITNYAMLEYLMLRPDDSIFFSEKYADLWKYIILDEAHVYNGSTGIEVSMLLRRLKATIKNNNIRYILTSATLGDKDSNKEVANFAKRLCDSEFKEENIIRAYREDTLKFKPTTKLRIDFYNIVGEMLDGKYEDNEINKKIKNMTSNNLETEILPKLLFDILSKDELYINIRKDLIRPEKIKYIQKKYNLTSKDLTNFVKVASLAEKNNVKLFDARYHMFIKATESVFITLKPSSKLFLKRRKNYFESNGESYKVFEIGTCQFCNDIYIIGKIENNHLIQTSSIGPDDNKSIFLLGDEISDTDADHTLEDEKIDTQEYEVCSKCGYILKSNLVNKEYCEHGKKYYTRIIKVKISNETGRLTKCLSCENTSNFGIIRMFFSGQEAVTSVIGTALYEELPSYSITKDVKIEEDHGFGFGETIIKGNKEKKSKQFLSFSDNRQAAAFYATYLDQTYRNILYKRLIVETLNDQIENEGKNIYQFVDNLTNKFEKYEIATYNSDKVKKEAWKAILHEIVDNNGSTSLYKMGMLGISVEDNNVPSNKKLKLTQKEVSDICSVLAMGIMTDAALTYNANINKSDKAFFTHGVECKYTLSDSKSKEYTRSFIPTKAKMKNKRVDYLEKVLNKKGFNLPLEETCSILKGIWKVFFVGDKFELMKNIQGYYKLDVEKIKVYRSNKWYICPKCKKVTAHNVENICPTYKCDGILETINLEEEFKDNHYYNLYKNMDIRELKIVEHTAQLDKETAYDYQKRFKKKQIDILSCSTTFEMGVDVGSLETVFMRNVPPSPANYAQRAGRAGRSSNSAAFALTFCNKSNHDFAYFNKPEQMIKGKISPPIFNEINNKIAIRHLYASALSQFWKKNTDYFSNTEKMLEEDENGISGVKAFEIFLKEKPENLKKFANDFLPAELIYEFKINNFGWIDKIIGENENQIGVLKKAEKSYFYEVQKIDEEIQRAIKSEDSKIVRLYSRRKVYKNENIISFFSRKNVLPKYGFPVDTVSMSIYDNKYNKNLGVELQRDLAMAIGEYAPGSEIIANGQLITSRYIKKLPNMSWKMYDYVICDECRTLNIEPHVSDDEMRELNVCRLCKEPFRTKKMDTFLIPEFGFEADGDNIKKPGLIKPEKTYRSEISYVGYRNNIKPKEFEIGQGKIELMLSQGDEMAVLNTSKFFVCESCGYTELNEKTYSYTKQKKHKNSSGYNCPNKYLKRYSLGYRFETDVIQLRFIQPDIDNWESGLSILNGILRGVCNSLNIEDSDISGTLRYFSNKFTNRANYAIILYDKTPGGSGHVRRLNDENILNQVLKDTYKIVYNCTCGGETGDSACYSCLKNYYNQKYHDKLQRKYVMDFIKKMYE